MGDQGSEDDVSLDDVLSSLERELEQDSNKRRLLLKVDSTTLSFGDSPQNEANIIKSEIAFKVRVDTRSELNWKKLVDLRLVRTESSAHRDQDGQYVIGTLNIYEEDCFISLAVQARIYDRLRNCIVYRGKPLIRTMRNLVTLRDVKRQWQAKDSLPKA